MLNVFNLREDSLNCSKVAEQEHVEENKNKDENGWDLDLSIDDFEVEEDKSSGSFGDVHRAIHRVSKTLCAIKKMKMKVVNLTEKETKKKFKRETEIMSKIDHPNIVKYYTRFSDENYYYIVMEYLPNEMRKRKEYSSKRAAKITFDIISAVYYLHNMSPCVIHRDIKTQNIVINEKDNKATLIDFGEANYLGSKLDEKYEAFRRTRVGTSACMAPEIKKGMPYNEKVDIWAIGVMLYDLINEKDFDNIRSVSDMKKFEIKFPQDVNTDAKDLIKKILVIQPTERPSLVEILKHPFFIKNIGDCSKNLINPLLNLKSKNHPLINSNRNLMTMNKSPTITNDLKENKLSSINSNAYINGNAMRNNNTSINESLTDNSFDLTEIRKNIKLKDFSKDNFIKLKDEKKQLENKVLKYETDNKNLTQQLEATIKDKENITLIYNQLQKIFNESQSLIMEKSDMRFNIDQTETEKNLYRDFLTDDDWYFKYNKDNEPCQIRETDISQISILNNNNDKKSICCNCKNEFMQYKKKKEEMFTLFYELTRKLKIENKELQNKVEALQKEIDKEKQKYLKYDNYEEELKEKIMTIVDLKTKIIELEYKAAHK